MAEDKDHPSLFEEYNSGSQLVSQDPKMAAGLFCHEEEGK